MVTAFAVASCVLLGAVVLVDGLWPSNKTVTEEYKAKATRCIEIGMPAAETRARLEANGCIVNEFRDIGDGVASYGNTTVVQESGLAVEGIASVIVGFISNAGNRGIEVRVYCFVDKTGKVVKIISKAFMK
jgi:hypothetical protein